jgi:hypothetical protein
MILPQVTFISSHGTEQRDIQRWAGIRRINILARRIAELPQINANHRWSPNPEQGARFMLVK